MGLGIIVFSNEAVSLSSPGGECNPLSGPGPGDVYAGSVESHTQVPGVESAQTCDGGAALEAGSLQCSCKISRPPETSVFCPLHT